MAKKRQFLTQIDIDLIRRIKILAIERDVSASNLVQNALAEFLARHGSAPANSDQSIPCS
jgi:predicted transcriptional regulator